MSCRPDSRCTSTTRCTSRSSLQSGSPRLLTSIAFFRGKVKTYETPLVEVTKLDAPERKAAIFQYSVPALGTQARLLHLPDHGRR